MISITPNIGDGEKCFIDYYGAKSNRNPACGLADILAKARIQSAKAAMERTYVRLKLPVIGREWEVPC